MTQAQGKLSTNHLKLAKAWLLSLAVMTKNFFFHFFLTDLSCFKNPALNSPDLVNYAVKLLTGFPTFLSTGRVVVYPQNFHRMPVFIGHS